MDNIILWNELVKRELIDKMDVINLMEIMGEGIYSLVIINAKKVVTIEVTVVKANEKGLKLRFVRLVENTKVV